MSQSNARIRQAKPVEDGAEIAFENGASGVFPWLWLRDHAEDEASLDPQTLQRRVDTFALSESTRAARLDVTRDGAYLHVDWGDGGPGSTLSGALLERMINAREREVERAGGRRLWRKREQANHHCALGFADVVESDSGRAECLERIDAWGFALIEGVPPHEAASRSLFERFGYLRETLFGGLWRLSAELLEHEDTAYSRSFLGPHTDATYSHDAPGLQSFVCLEFDGSGGESVLVDGFAAAAALRRESPRHYETLTRVDVPGRYVEPGVSLLAQRPVLRLGASGEVIQVSFNNYDRAPFLLPAPEMREFYAAYRAFNALVNDRSSWLEIPLRPGAALVFDNWRTLHGRLEYTGKRVFCGCYHNREDFESALRVCRGE
ncbi:MAG: TauD/TfdA family dioxygenase [Gammaproteobacteria bacterium]